MMRKQIIFGISCLLLLGFLPNWENDIKTLGQGETLGIESATSTRPVLATTPELAAQIPLPALTARSVLAYDNATSSILYSHNFDQRVPVASLTKIVAALVIVERGGLDQVLTVQPEDIKVIGANMGLLSGERVMISDLLKAMLIASSNDATMVLADYYGGSPEAFVDLMNNKAKQLGMLNTHFENPVGFDHELHYSTAHDLSMAVKEFIKHEELAKIVQIKQYEIPALNVANYSHKISTTNKLLVENPNVIGIKTGFTSQAKGNLIIRSRQGQADVISIVLGSDNREEDSRRLLEWIEQVYRW